MIQLVHFNGSKFFLNPDIIKSVESTPDTVITLINDQKLLVKDKAEVVVRKFIDYQRLIHHSEQTLNIGE